MRGKAAKVSAGIRARGTAEAGPRAGEGLPWGQARSLHAPLKRAALLQRRLPTVGPGVPGGHPRSFFINSTDAVQPLSCSPARSSPDYLQGQVTNF